MTESAKIIPPKLKKGDKVGVVATSAPILSLGEEQIQRGYRYLKERGFEVVEHPQCRLVSGGTAGNIKERVTAIHQFAGDKSIKAVLSFWGGWNTNQILDGIDFGLIKSNPKVYMGYSDTCALLLAITVKTGLVTYTGPAVITFAKPDPFDYTWEYFSKVCIEKESFVKVKDAAVFADDLYFLRTDNDHRLIQKNSGSKVYREGKAEGETVAANLSTLLVLVGTPYFPDLQGKILFLEEAEDYGYNQIRREMVQLKQIGAMEKIKGLVLGKFMSASGVSAAGLATLLKELVADKEIPVIYDVNFGHTDPVFTCPNGIRARISTAPKRITFFF